MRSESVENIEDGIQTVKCVNTEGIRFSMHICSTSQQHINHYHGKWTMLCQILRGQIGSPQFIRLDFF